jgi:AraC family transcriptional regulator
VIARGRDWSVAEYVCTAGPSDRSFEEQHETFTVAAVVEGSFRYTSDTGTSLLHPGSWLLGNHRRCFSCGHDHSRGDRCIAFHLSPECFAEISASLGGSANYEFRYSMLPATMRGLSMLARAQSMIGSGDTLARDEAVTELLEAVVVETSEAHPTPQTVLGRDERRISAALHHLEDHFTEPLGLDQLAAVAGMSKYHFVRTFRHVLGRSPHQYLVGLRLQHVAERLTITDDLITEIALNCGFGDISTFASQFRRQFGETPSQYRRRYQ